MSIGRITQQPSLVGLLNSSVWHNSLVRRVGRVAGCVPGGGRGRACDTVGGIAFYDCLVLLFVVDCLYFA